MSRSFTITQNGFNREFDITQEGVTKEFTITQEGFNREFTIEDGVGSSGASAYQIALDNGFIGTEQEWLASLQGTDADVTNAAVNAAIEDDPAATGVSLGLATSIIYQMVEISFRLLVERWTQEQILRLLTDRSSEREQPTQDLAVTAG